MNYYQSTARESTCIRTKTTRKIGLTARMTAREGRKYGGRQSWLGEGTLSWWDSSSVEPKLVSESAGGFGEVDGEENLFMSRQFRYRPRSRELESQSLSSLPASGGGTWHTLKEKLRVRGVVRNDKEIVCGEHEEQLNLNETEALLLQARRRRKARSRRGELVARCNISSEDSSSDSSGSDSEADVAAVHEKGVRPQVASIQNSVVSGVGIKFNPVAPLSENSDGSSLPKVLVCSGKGCSKRGADELFFALQSGRHANVVVDRCKCLGQCRNGPTLKIENGEHLAKVTNVQIQDLDQIVQGVVA